jgi:uncharacterized membrane protein YfcA
MILHYLGIFIIGMIIGFLGGLFGKGGSSIATPMLNLIGIPDFASVTAPLPATIPGTFIASVEYWKFDLLDREIVIFSILTGIPSTILGAYLTKFTGAIPLLVITGLLVLSFGVSFIFKRKTPETDLLSQEGKIIRPKYWHLRLVVVALFVGLISGFLANSGGFLLAPGYIRILKLPIKKAFACSLFVSMFLAIPGTVMHTIMGHMNWMVTIVLAIGSVPFSYLGARTAIRSDAVRLERWYGFVLTALGSFFLLKLL